MDISKIFKYENKKEIFDFLKNNAFGLLVSHGSNHPEATHVPYVIVEEEGGWYIYSHMASGNRHTDFLSGQSEHLFVVKGVDHYISSSWYDHENVPTWNYISVHLIGSIQVQEGAEAVQNIRLLMNRLEPSNKSPRSFEKLDPGMVKRHMEGLIAFRMQVNGVEGAKKLSQNRDRVNQQNVIKELEKLNNSKAMDVAIEMLRNMNDQE